MDDNKCLLCGLNVDAGRQVCKFCESTLAPYNGLLQATIDRSPVEHRGIKYGCISAFIIRTRASATKAIRKRFIVQVELMSGRAQSVTIADPNEVKILTDRRPADEQGN